MGSHVCQTIGLSKLRVPAELLRWPLLLLRSVTACKLGSVRVSKGQLGSVRVSKGQLG